MQEYFDNVGLFYVFAKQLGVPREDMDDFLQEAFLSVVESKEALEAGEYSTVSILRMAVKHRWFLHCLNNKYVCKLTYSGFKSGTDNYTGYVPYDSLTASSDVSTESLELWESVQAIVGDDTAFLLWLRFKCDATFTEIAEIFGITKSAASKRYYRALERLRNYKELL